MDAFLTPLLSPATILIIQDSAADYQHRHLAVPDQSAAKSASVWLQQSLRFRCTICSTNNIWLKKLQHGLMFYSAVVKLDECGCPHPCWRQSPRIGPECWERADSPSRQVSCPRSYLITLSNFWGWSNVIPDSYPGGILFTSYLWYTVSVPSCHGICSSLPTVWVIDSTLQHS